MYIFKRLFEINPTPLLEQLMASLPKDEVQLFVFSRISKSEDNTVNPPPLLDPPPFDFEVLKRSNHHTQIDYK